MCYSTRLAETYGRYTYQNICIHLLQVEYLTIFRYDSTLCLKYANLFVVMLYIISLYFYYQNNVFSTFFFYNNRNIAIFRFLYFNSHLIGVTKCNQIKLEIIKM